MGPRGQEPHGLRRPPELEESVPAQALPGRGGGGRTPCPPRGPGPRGPSQGLLPAMPGWPPGGPGAAGGPVLGGLAGEAGGAAAGGCQAGVLVSENCRSKWSSKVDLPYQTGGADSGQGNHVSKFRTGCISGSASIRSSAVSSTGMLPGKCKPKIIRQAVATATVRAGSLVRTTRRFGCLSIPIPM